jgi:hypothetical protein
MTMHLYRVIPALFLCLLSCERGGEARPKPTPDAAAAAASKTVEQALAFYESRPQYERPIAHSEVPEGLSDYRSETCGGCHQEIYREWSISTHRRAWLDDAQFQEELAKSRRQTGAGPGDVSWLCVNCHTPMVNQLERLVVGLEGDAISKPLYVDNPTFDPVAQLDAIGCASCHVRDGTVLGPYGDTKAPHPTKKADSLLTEEVCTRCHQAEQFYASENLACLFSTGREWEGSQAARQGQPCQHCHMPEVKRKLAEAFDLPERVTRRHWFGGSMIPKQPKFEPEIAAIREHYPDGIRITLEPATDALRELAKARPGLAEVDQKIADARRVECSAKGCSDVVVVMKNLTGHSMPTGDPERHVDVEVRARIGEKVVAAAWTRIGSRYAWWPETKLLADTRLEPDSPQALRLLVPNDPRVQIEVRAQKQRMYKEAFEHHALEGRYVRGREFLRQTWVRDEEDWREAPESP